MLRQEMKKLRKVFDTTWELESLTQTESETDEEG